MTIKPGLKDFCWMAVGAIIFLVPLLIVLFFQKEQNPSEQAAAKAEKLEVVGRMRFSLASAAEAEKSAVMAITEQDSQTFADQARAASAVVEQRRRELADLLETGGTRSEKDFFEQFSRDFTEFQRIDNEVLSLAVKNSNLKAYSLAFGPAAEALRALDTALAPIVADGAKSTSPEARQVILLASGAQSGALRIQTLLPPHIAEESDEKMNALEALMTQEDHEVRKNLEGLASLLKSIGSTELENAASSYARFTEIKAQILKLSRENTNVRSLAISLNQKRKVTVMCQEALAALEQAIREEPMAGMRYKPQSPR